MKPPKRIVLCGRDRDELDMLAFVLRMRMRLGVSVASHTQGVLEVARAAPDDQNIRLVVYVHQDRINGDVAVSMRDVEAFRGLCSDYGFRLLVWDRSENLPIEGDVIRGLPEMVSFMETISKRLAPHFFPVRKDKKVV